MEREPGAMLGYEDSGQCLGKKLQHVCSHKIFKSFFSVSSYIAKIKAEENKTCRIHIIPQL
jgi:hypothetical protein